MKRSKLVLCLLLLALLLSACSTNNKANNAAGNKGEQKEEVSSEKSAIVIGQTWLLSALDPTNSSVPWSMTSAGISENLYMLDKDGVLYSRFISNLEKVDELNWKAVLKEDVKFSNGDVVDAKAVCDAMNEIMKKNELSNATAGVIEFKPTGDFTFDMVTERPTLNMKSIFAEWSNIIFKDLGNGEYAFTGPYKVKKLDAEIQLDLEPNEHYPNADKRGEVTIKLFKDEAAMKLAFEAEEVDMAFTVTPEVAGMLQGEGRIVKTIEAGYQYFGIFNLESPIISDLKVRQALNLGLNREDYLQALKGGRVANGVFATYYAYAGDSKVEYKLEEANKLLDEAGWTKGSDGIRQKDGKVLELNVATYPSRPDLGTIMQIMASQAQALGIKLNTQLVDNIDEFAASGKFDLILYAQHTAPTGDPTFFLNQFFRTEQAKNFSRYNSKDMNALLDKMGAAPSEEQRDALAKEAQALIFKDLPVLYLVDPQWHIALSEKLKNYEPFCGDYYVVNAQLGLE